MATLDILRGRFPERVARRAEEPDSEGAISDFSGFGLRPPDLGSEADSASSSLWIDNVKNGLDAIIGLPFEPGDLGWTGVLDPDAGSANGDWARSGNASMLGISGEPTSEFAPSEILSSISSRVAAIDDARSSSMGGMTRASVDSERSPI